MRAHTTFILFLIAATAWGAYGLAADGEPKQAHNRFTQAGERTFATFDPQVEQTWQGSFFFMQLADTQYGFFNENKSFEQEVALVEKTVQRYQSPPPSLCDRVW